MYTATTKLRHRQTHSTHPTSLCSDHSHLTGFPLPINVPPLGSAVYLLLSDFFLWGAWGGSEAQREWKICHAVSRSACDPQTGGVDRSAAAQAWRYIKG